MARASTPTGRYARQPSSPKRPTGLAWAVGRANGIVNLPAPPPQKAKPNLGTVRLVPAGRNGGQLYAARYRCGQ